MARRRYGRRRHSSHRSKRIPLGATIGAALAAYTAYRCWADNKASYTNIRNSFMLRLTGYDVVKKSWTASEAYIPLSLGAGVAVSAIGSKMKLNKYLPRPIAF